MTEYNYFCWAKEYNDKDSFQQQRYRVFNVEVSKEEYNKISKLYDKLEFDPNESYDTRFQTAFKKMWNSIPPERQQEYLNIPHFNWEGFTFITGITPEDVKDTMSGKEVKIKNLFDMVYEWGRAGIVVDFESNAFRKALKEVLSDNK